MWFLQALGQSLALSLFMSRYIKHGNGIPAKWLKPQKSLPRTGTLVNLTAVPIVVLVLLGILFH